MKLKVFMFLFRKERNPSDYQVGSKGDWDQKGYWHGIDHNRV